MNKIYENIEAIRKDFPILLSVNSQNHPLTYLDNAATTQKPLSVIKRMWDYYTKENCNIHRGKYELSNQTSKAYDNARRDIADFIGASPETIIFTSGTTGSLNFVATTFEPLLKSGNVVLVSEMEHHSDLVPFQRLCKKTNSNLVAIPITEKGDININAYKDLIIKYAKRIKLICVAHISNSIGTINPIKQMIQIARFYDIPVCIDAAQSIAHSKIDVKYLDCDFLAFSGHKCYADTGIGVLYMSPKFESILQPYQFGGGMIQSVTFNNTTYADIPHRFEAGTPHIAGVLSLQTAFNYIKYWGIVNIYNYEKHLTDYCVDKLKKIPSVKIIGEPEQRGAIISFTVSGMHPDDVCLLLSNYNICVRSGYLCSLPLMEKLKLPNGVARVSFSIFNTLKEIDNLCTMLEKIKS